MLSIRPRMLWGIAILVAVSFVIQAQPIHAQEITVFDVRKTLPLTPTEPVYQDFYLNAGTEAGIRPGLIVTVKRRSTLYDSYQNRSPGDILVPVGELRIIHAQKGMSVARLHELLSRDTLPVLDVDYVMVGDRLDMTTAHMGSGKAKKKSEEARAPEPVAPSAPAEPAPETAKVEAQSAQFSSRAPEPEPVKVPTTL